MSDAVVVAVIGAGNVGCALAADLVLRGAEVRMCNRSAARLEPIREAGGITVTGAVEGFAPIGMLTCSLDEAVRGADVVAVTVPTPALPHYAAALIDATAGDQLIWLDPGHCGGALYLAAEMARTSGRRGRCLAQVSTASHGSRMAGPATVGVFALPAAALAAFPGTAADECHARVDALLPGQFTKAPTVLDLDLLNINAVLHPPLMVADAGWIEATGGDFHIYQEGSGPAASRLIEAVDGERMALAARLGVTTMTLVEFLFRSGYTSAEAAGTGRVHAALQAGDAIAAVKAPPALDHRYLHEDVGWGLVPWLSLADHVGVPAPAMAAITELAGIFNEVDYREVGLTLDRMGLAGLDADSIVAYAASGER